MKGVHQRWDKRMDVLPDATLNTKNPRKRYLCLFYLTHAALFCTQEENSVVIAEDFVIHFDFVFFLFQEHKLLQLAWMVCWDKAKILDVTVVDCSKLRVVGVDRCQEFDFFTQRSTLIVKFESTFLHRNSLDVVAVQ